MARITVEDCIDKFPSRFELVLVASQRARKLHSGDSPTVEKDNDKNTVIALREIAESAITPEVMKENLIQEYQTITINDEEDENLEIDALENAEKNSEILNSDDQKELPVAKNEAEEEIASLISAEDSEIEKQYEITDNLENEIVSENNDETNNEEQIASNNDETNNEEQIASNDGANNTQDTI